MVSRSRWVTPIALLLLGACEGGSPAPRAESLGITELRIDQRDSELEVIGVDRDGLPVAQLLYRAGRVIVPDDGREADGRSLVVRAGEAQAEHASEGFGELKLPLFEGPDATALNGFLLDPRISALLAERGIRFADPELPASGSSSERGFAACSYATNPTCGATACCEWQQLATYEKVCCGGPHTLVQRSCSSYPGSSACGNNGPAGCAICWQTSWSYECDTWTSGGGTRCDHILDGVVTCSCLGIHCQSGYFCDPSMWCSCQPI